MSLSYRTAVRYAIGMSESTGTDLATTDVPRRGTVRNVPRARGEIPDKERNELLAARKAREAAIEAADAAEERFRAAINAAYLAGGSHTVIADTAGVVKSTVQKYVTARRTKPD